MNYNKVVSAKFIERDNRFVARVSLTNVGEVGVHVKNTGRCKELLVPGATVYLEDHADKMGARKYRYDLIAVEKETPEKTILINMDSQAPNKVVDEALKTGNLCLSRETDIEAAREEAKQCAYHIIRPETTFGSSRFDFYTEAYTRSADDNPRRAFIEVKGVTLEDNGIARFPDAPTERGIKHINELEQALADGYEAYIVFVIQMKGIRHFEPNDATHPEFGEALRNAEKAGVRILAYDCKVEPDRLSIDQPIQIRL